MIKIFNSGLSSRSSLQSLSWTQQVLFTPPPSPWSPRPRGEDACPAPYAGSHQALSLRSSSPPVQPLPLLTLVSVLLLTCSTFSSLPVILGFVTDLIEILPWVKKAPPQPAAKFPLLLIMCISLPQSSLLLSRICCFLNLPCLLSSGIYFLLFLHPRTLCFHPSFPEFSIL